jgi:hypothetical protein
MSWIIWARNRDQRENSIYPMTNRAGQPGFDENGYYTGP